MGGIDDAAVEEGDDAMADVGGLMAVGDEHDGGAGLIGEFAEQSEDVGAVFGVEVAGGFVGEDDAGSVDEGACDGDALLFAAGELGRFRGGAMLDADALEKLLDAWVTFGCWNADQLEGEFDIFEDGEGWEEVEELEDGADLGSAEEGETLGIELAELGGADADGAGVGAVDAAEAIEEGGFAAARGSHEGDAFAGMDGKGDVAENGARFVGFLNVFDLDDRVGTVDGHEVNGLWCGMGGCATGSPSALTGPWNSPPWGRATRILHTVGLAALAGRGDEPWCGGRAEGSGDREDAGERIQGFDGGTS